MVDSDQDSGGEINPFYHGALTNVLGGAVWGFLQPYLYPAIPLSQQLPYIFARILIGVGVGLLFSVGILVLSILPLSIFKRFEENVESRFFKDLIYSFSSIVVTVLILTFLVVCLVIIYGGRIPLVPINYITFKDYLYSLLNTEWTKIGLIPVVGASLKSVGGQLRDLLFKSGA